jgi:hypothetical protein
MQTLSTIGIGDLARQFELPLSVLRHWLDNHGYTTDRRYPHQRRRVPADKLTEIRRRLRADGFRLPA